MSRISPKRLIRNISPRSAAGFAIGYFLSLAVIVITAIIVFGEGRIISLEGQTLRIVLAANGLLIFSLAAVVIVRLRRRIRGRKFGEPAPRLHLRFVTLFFLAAAVPAVLSGLFLGAVLTRGVDQWFGERVTAVVEAASNTAANFFEERANDARGAMLAMAYDLTQDDAIEAFTNSRIQYVNYLRGQTSLRSFNAAYVVDRRGNLLARSRFSEDDVYLAPSEQLYEWADDGDVGVTSPGYVVQGNPEMRLLMKLEGYEDAYLYVSRSLNSTLFQEAESAALEYRRGREQEGVIRLTFFVIFLEFAVLTLIGATWLALSSATRVVTPISRLVAAAERVRRGDLDARVQMTREDDEITALGRAFNRMTRQLRSQRRELIEAHAEAEQRRAFTEAVLAGVSAGVVGLDGENRVTLVNRSAVALIGPDTDNVIGVSLDDVAPELAEIVLQARRHPGVVAEGQIEIHNADDQTRNLSVRATMDEEAGLVITFDDVTRLVTAQRNSAWRDVARRIAHEIKNPLTPIQLSAERLRRKYRKEIETDVETFDRCTETIVRQVSDIGRMVDEFSSFARMPQPKVEDVEIDDVAQSAVFAQRVASPNIDVPYQRPDEAVMALCDARLSRQALANILKNAAESVSARVKGDGGSGEEGRISVEVRKEAGFAVVEVQDNGLGWPTANRERLTEPYMTTREKGTGLGLAIVKRVMEDHKGRLELAVPASGNGAVVRLVFPLAEATDTRFEQQEEA